MSKTGMLNIGRNMRRTTRKYLDREIDGSLISQKGMRVFRCNRIEPLQIVKGSRKV